MLTEKDSDILDITGITLRTIAYDIKRQQELTEIHKKALTMIARTLEEIVATNGNISKEKSKEFGNFFIELGKEAAKKHGERK